MKPNRFSFRAWDKASEAMYEAWLCSTDGDIIAIQNPDDEWSEMRSHEECILMQSTGLTDKNGKEIFEGDIISHNNKLYVITWFQAEFILQTKRSFYTKGIVEGIFQAGFAALECDEILGNVYETPELLK
jgi:uncharacterized phage protein (TIGR01671 family)